MKISSAQNLRKSFFEKFFLRSLTHNSMPKLAGKMVNLPFGPRSWEDQNNACRRKKRVVALAGRLTVFRSPTTTTVPPTGVQNGKLTAEVCSRTNPVDGA